MTSLIKKLQTETYDIELLKRDWGYAVCVRDTETAILLVDERFDSLEKAEAYYSLVSKEA